MTRLSYGVWGTVLLSLSGVWLVMAPFVLGFQDPGRAWSPATRGDVAVGGVLAVAGVAGALGHILFWARDAALAAARLRSGEAEGPPGSPGSAS